MPLEIDTPRFGAARHRESLVVGLVNNMPDSALEGTELQFSRLLEAASGSTRVRLRFSYLPEVARSAAARERIERDYWTIEALQASAPDALIVTGAEPLAGTVQEEPYWQSFVRVLSWADAHTHSSIWSCLAAHAAVEHLDGVRRRRLPQKRFGVFEHQTLAGHPLTRDLGGALRIPHSRWNELPVESLRAAGYVVASGSAENGADMFTKKRRSLLVFLQGHPEYEINTLLKEYRRDVGRYLRGEQAHYPTLPANYFAGPAQQQLEEFRTQALARRAPELLTEFPAAAATGLQNVWTDSALQIYRNWLSLISAARIPAPAADTAAML